MVLRLSVRVIWIVGCATIGCGPTKLYPGPQRPDSEVALLQASSEARVIAIDDAPVMGSSWTLLPGRHDVWLRVRLFSQAPNMHWTVWSYCNAAFLAEPGSTYSTRVRAKKEIGSGLSERIEMEVGIADSDGALHAAVQTCTAERPELNR